MSTKWTISKAEHGGNKRSSRAKAFMWLLFSSEDMDKPIECRFIYAPGNGWDMDEWNNAAATDMPEMRQKDLNALFAAPGRTFLAEVTKNAFRLVDHE